MSRRWLVIYSACSVLLCTGCFMGPVDDNPVVSSLSISQAQCQMTVQNNSFAGLCAQIQISNTGVEAMSGWLLAFDLPPDGHLQNSWNANFQVDGQHVTVTPTGDGNLDVGHSVMLGYCASQTGNNIVATPGRCNGGEGTAITQDVNGTLSGIDPNAIDPNVLVARGVAAP